MDPVAELITGYHELNGSRAEELDEEPSPLEFSRFVARNSPFVVRGAARDWAATKQWSAAYLLEALRGHRVNVAVTPFGNADAPTVGPDGETLFAKPHEEEQPFEDFLAYLVRQELGASSSDNDASPPPPPPADGEVRYAQTQNDNLRHEYGSLFAQCQASIPFARIALQRDPDAINMWVGNSRSVTALHRDNYENVYVQVAGRKHFVLLPALCQPCVGERSLQAATYVREGDDKLALKIDEGQRVPFATWDPDEPAGKGATQYSSLAAPVRVTLNPGDMLYLPAMWYHKVSQTCSDDGICVAVNYWYDMDFGGSLYSLNDFVRNTTLARQS